MDSTCGHVSRNPVLVITVPHTFHVGFLPREMHATDFSALDAARDLQKAFSANVVTRVFVGDVPRFLVDLNRPQSRNTQWRRRVTDLLRFLGRRAVQLDVHSFPDDPWTGKEIVVMDTARGHEWARDLAKGLRRRGINAYYIRGSPRNDLIQTSEALHVPAVLLEFNEKLASPRRREIAAALAAELLPAMWKRVARLPPHTKIKILP